MQSNFESFIHVEPATGRMLSACGDVALQVATPIGILYGVFDGAGRSPLDRLSADGAAAAVMAAAVELRAPRQFVGVLEAAARGVVDQAGKQGAATAALALIADDGVYAVGASDAEVWGSPDGHKAVLLSARRARGRLGPDFTAGEDLLNGPFPAIDILILATDGLFGHLWAEHALPLAREVADPAREMARQIVRRHHHLPDDYAAIVLRSSNSPAIRAVG